MAVHKDDAAHMTAGSTEKPAITETGAPQGTSAVTRKPSGIKHYLHEVLVELKKTTWPSKNELTKSTVVVAATIVIVAVLLFVYDKAAAFVMSKVLLQQ